MKLIPLSTKAVGFKTERAFILLGHRILSFIVPESSLVVVEIESVSSHYRRMKLVMIH